MLKVNIDHGHDYFRYLQPFVLHVLVTDCGRTATDQEVADRILDTFGLVIPIQTVKLVLGPICRKYSIRKDGEKYRLPVLTPLPDPAIGRRRAAASRDISAVVNGLIKFSRDGQGPIDSEEDAFAALQSFLSKFDISCLRADLRGTMLPNPSPADPKTMFTVSDYVIHLQKREPGGFESFMVMVRGHMMANALLCLDIHSTPKNYKNVTFYLDAPLIFDWLKLHGESRKRAVSEMIDLLRRLHGKIAIFGHTLDECKNVIYAAANSLHDTTFHSSILLDARRDKMTRSDLVLVAEKLDETLRKDKIQVQKTPEYVDEYQIDETEFQRLLDEERPYRNPKAKEFDINSLRSIYVLRGSSHPISIEKCKGIFVTRNTPFKKAAWKFDRSQYEARTVPSVISDFVISNLAWLKAPVDAPGLPRAEVLAYCYGAMRPTPQMMEKVMTEIDRLREREEISALDHELMRTSPMVPNSIMRSTYGDERAVDAVTVKDALASVVNQITRKKDQEIAEEVRRRGEEVRQREEEVRRREQVERRMKEHIEDDKRLNRKLYRICDLIAKTISWFVMFPVSVLIVVGLLSDSGIRWFASHPWITGGGILVSVVIGLLSLWEGPGLRKWNRQMTSYIRKYLFKRMMNWLGKSVDALDGGDDESVSSPESRGAPRPT